MDVGVHSTLVSVVSNGGGADPHRLPRALCVLLLPNGNQHMLACTPTSAHLPGASEVIKALQGN